MLGKPVINSRVHSVRGHPREGGVVVGGRRKLEGLGLSLALSGSWKGDQGRVCGKEVWRGVVGRDLPARTKLEEGAAPRLEASGKLDSVVQQGGTRVRWSSVPEGLQGHWLHPPVQGFSN